VGLPDGQEARRAGGARRGLRCPGAGPRRQDSGPSSTDSKTVRFHRSPTARPSTRLCARSRLRTPVVFARRPVPGRQRVRHAVPGHGDPNKGPAQFPVTLAATAFSPDARRWPERTTRISRSGCGTRSPARSGIGCRPPTTGWTPWRSPRTARPWPPGATAASSACGTWPRARRSAHLRAPRPGCRPWRSPPTANCWRPAATTTGSGCGTRQPVRS
jgi:hypothetical protein